MKTVRHVAQVDEAKCIGCPVCINVCPTEATSVLNRKAKVDADKCLACCNCWQACPVDALKLVPRLEPRTFGLDPNEVDQSELRELCASAHLHPKQVACLCSGTTVREVAAAVIQGAHSLEELALMTGARSGCTIYCTEPMLRLLKAHGVNVSTRPGYSWYDGTPNLWDIPEEVEQKRTGYFFAEDRKVFRKI